MSVSSTTATPASRAAAPFWGFLWQETLTLLRSRRMKLLLGMLIYAILGMPFILQKTPEDITKFVSMWFGTTDIGVKTFLFVWTDVAMNKLCVFAGIVLGGGIIIDERAKGTDAVFLSKPISIQRYYLVKILAASLTMLLLYLTGTIVGSVYFSFMAKHFDVVKFLALSSTHILAAVFAVTFSGVIGVMFERKLGGMITSLMFLFLLVGSAFIGFYNPKWLWAGYANPFYYGVALIAKLDNYGVWNVLQAVLILLVFNAVAVTAGVWRAGRLQE